MKTILRFFLLSFVFIQLKGCIPPPVFPAESGCERNEFRGTFVLNEGNFGQNNGRIDAWEDTSRCAGVFQQVNNQPLGDVANFALIEADTLFVIINNSRLIHKVQLPSMELLATMALPTKSSPREMVIIDPTQAFVTSFHTKQLYIINPVDMQIIDSVEIENSMEDIIFHENKLFVSCGSHPVDGINNKLAILDIERLQPRYLTLPIDNPGDLAVYQNQVLVSCKGDFNPNGAGSAVVSVDAVGEEINWSLNFTGSSFDLEVAGDQLYVIRDSSITKIGLRDQQVEEAFITKGDLEIGDFDLIYSLTYDEQVGELYIGIAPFGAVDGYVVRMNPFLEIVEQKKAGLFPGQVFFYR